jgi:hypothetical protein
LDDEGVLPVHLSIGLRPRADACASAPRLSSQDTSRDSASVLLTAHTPIAPELLYQTAKLAALVPFGKVAAFLRADTITLSGIPAASC